MEIRCPQCRKKLGNRVLGLYVTDCPRCHTEVRVVMRGSETVTFKGERYEILCRPKDSPQLAEVRLDGVDTLPLRGVYSPTNGVDDASG